MLRLNLSGEKPAGASDVDATRPLPLVVDELLRLAGCTATSDAPLQPWSRRGSTSGEAFVVSVLRQEAIRRIEYGWSGDLLTTLLQYLEEQGIHLRQPGAFFLLTADHRERYATRLDPSTFDGRVLQRHYEELTGRRAEGVGYALLDGIAFFRDTLEALDATSVAVLVIR
jgi:hypothetical protein